MTLDTEENGSWRSLPTENVRFRTRWRQSGFSGETTGVVDLAFDEALDLCQRVNVKWRGDVEQWPVAYEIDRHGKPAKEIEDLRHLFGFGPVQKAEPARQAVLIS